jgi:hypothetical protein
LVKRAAVIKPVPEELRWQQIPWVMDLTEGQRLAKAALPDLLLSSPAHAYAGEYGRTVLRYSERGRAMTTFCDSFPNAP